MDGHHTPIGEKFVQHTPVYEGSRRKSTCQEVEQEYGEGGGGGVGVGGRGDGETKRENVQEETRTGPRRRRRRRAKVQVKGITLEIKRESRAMGAVAVGLVMEQEE